MKINKSPLAFIKFAVSCLLTAFLLDAAAGAGLAFDPGRLPANDCAVKLPLALDICACDNMKTVEISVKGKFEATISSRDGNVLKKVSGDGLALKVISVNKSKAATIEYYSVIKTMPYKKAAGAVPGDETSAVIDKIEKLAGGLKFFTYGCVLSPGAGEKIDIRTLFLAKGPFSDEESAKKYSNEFYEKNKILPFVHPVRTALPEYALRVKLSYADGQKRETELDAGGAITINASSEVALEDAEFGRGEKWHRFKDARYPAPVTISPDNSGLCQVVTRVNFEDLLKTVVPSEIEPKSPYQAICAQAVAARTEILSKIRERHTENGYDFCAGTHCQAYGGLANNTAEAARAVEETAGMIITSNGHIVDTVYHANCGGVTEDSNKIWSAPYEPSLVTRPDTINGKIGDFSTDEAALKNFIEKPPATFCSVKGACDNSDKFRWTRKFTQDEIDALVAKQFKIGHLKEIKVIERGKSGRITGIELAGELGKERLYKELPIRRLLGMLRSALFVVDVKETAGKREFHFNGAGWGHGVGLCQDGAKGMGISGMNFKDILMHYYSNSKIVKIY